VDVAEISYVAKFEYVVYQNAVFCLETLICANYKFRCSLI